MELITTLRLVTAVNSEHLAHAVAFLVRTRCQQDFVTVGLPSNIERMANRGKGLSCCPHDLGVCASGFLAYEWRLSRSPELPFSDFP
jgi:hypothetical protein